MSKKQDFILTGSTGFKRSLVVLFLSFIIQAAVLSTVLILPLMNCSVPLPPAKIKKPEPPTPPPPPEPPKPAKKCISPKIPGVAKDSIKEESLDEASNFATSFGVEGGVEGGIEGGILGGVADGVPGSSAIISPPLPPQFNTEEYARIYDNSFLAAMDNPLSTFSIDVDTGSYSNVRRYLTNHQLPPTDAVRIEEMINYFKYDYPSPKKKHPFSISTELTTCSWNPLHLLLHIGIKGKELKPGKIAPSNLVFLIDVSGSMDSPDKLPLLQSSFKLLVENLTAKDHVALVVYAGAAGLVLPPTPGNEKKKILDAIDQLRAGGCTAGGEGILLAYKTAEENFLKKGNNRIILATDGDFNIGVSSTSELVRMIEEKREKGIFLTTMGFGTGNYKDNRLEQLADKGNGNYFYIDSIKEGKKVFVYDMRGTLFTIAKDVKIQVEFNPVKVKSYRLIGYENRELKKEDFNNDKKDAGDLGSGHTVTALYEIAPNSNESSESPTIPLRFQETHVKKEAFKSREIALIKLRYKKPEGTISRLITRPVEMKNIEHSPGSNNSRFSAAVAMFGMLLRKSEHAGDSSYEKVLSLAKKSLSYDPNGYRSEFLRMVSTAAELAGNKQ